MVLPNLHQMTVSPYVLQSPKNYAKMARILQASKGGMQSKDPSGLVLSAHQDLEQSLKKKVAKNPFKMLGKASKIMSALSNWKNSVHMMQNFTNSLNTQQRENLRDDLAKFLEAVQKTKPNTVVKEEKPDAVVPTESVKKEQNNTPALNKNIKKETIKTPPAVKREEKVEGTGDKMDTDVKLENSQKNNVATMETATDDKGTTKKKEGKDVKTPTPATRQMRSDDDFSRGYSGYDPDHQLQLYDRHASTAGLKGSVVLFGRDILSLLGKYIKLSPTDTSFSMISKDENLKAVQTEFPLSFTSFVK